GLTGNAPVFDPDIGLTNAGLIPQGEGDWRRLLAVPLTEDFLVAFDRDVQAYRYVKEYRGRCGWDLRRSDWSSRTERGHLLALPRLEMLGCDLVDSAGWDWIMSNLSGLMQFEAKGPMIDAPRIAGLKRLPRLRALALRGNAAGDTTAVDTLPGLRHLALGPF